MLARLFASFDHDGQFSLHPSAAFDNPIVLKWHVAAVRGAVGFNITPLVDAWWNVAAAPEASQRSVSAWILDHAEDDPFPSTLWWWRDRFESGKWSLFGVLGLCAIWWPDDEDRPFICGRMDGIGARLSHFAGYGRATTACTNVRIVDDRSAPRWRREAREKGHPLFEWKTVEVPRCRVRRPVRPGDPERASPRLHPVRRHLVRLPGRTIRRGPFWRGDARKGVVLHDYRVEGPE